MKFRTAVFVTATLCLGFTAAAAKDAVVEKRENMMKQVGASMGTLASIAKGDKAYDATQVKTALTAISTDLKAFPDQFPAGSEAESAAAPAIWENNADFRARAAKLANDADTVLAAMPADQAGVAKSMQILGGNCSGCHQTYRLKR